MTDFELIIQTIVASMATAGGTLWIASVRNKNKKLEDVSLSEVNDRAEFRRMLIDRVDRLQKDLDHCHAQHNKANNRINHLEMAMEKAGIEIGF